MKKKIPKPKKDKKTDKNQPQPDEKKDQFDFGGLPERDLKKNLGCG